jgi:hypothetical protein
MRKLFLITILSSLIISCEEVTDLPSPFSSHEQWHSYNIHNYSIEQVRSCFCVNGGERMKVTVRSDTVFQVMRISDSAIIPYPASKQYLTIDSLFGIINNSKTDSLIVEYNSKYGYPNKVDINPQLHPVDGGVKYETSNLQIF